MNFLAWSLSLSLLIMLVIKAVDFQTSMVCRQHAWLKSTELKTRVLLHKPLEKEVAVDPKCRIFIKRRGKEVSWQRLPSQKLNEFHLKLKGKI
jgi:hypothetical protein